MITHGPVKIERWRLQDSAAAAYLRRDHILLHGTCITTIGGFDCEPYLTLPTSVLAEQLGAVLLSVLAAAQIAVPPELPAERRKIFAVAGVRSLKKLYDEARYCSIYATPQRITISPHTLERGAFVGLRDREVIVDSPTPPEDLGRALTEGFSRCIPKVA